MKTPNFRKMSPKLLAAYQPKSQDEFEGLQKEKDYRQWCQENGDDYEDDQMRECYREATGETFWEDLDEDDRDGWEHNMNKD